MKKILWLLCGLFLCANLQAGVYNNSGTTAEDSIAFKFQYLDSLGRPVAAAANDSVYIIVSYPGGIEAFRDSMVYNDANITASAWEDFAYGESYTLRYAVADIDGTPVEGTYKVTVISQDNNLTLSASFNSEFQLYAAGDYSATLDDLAKEASLLTTSDNIGINWADVTNQSTSVNLSATTTNLVNTASTVTNQVTADVTAISGDASAADSLESELDGYNNAQLTNREHLFTNLDEVLSVRSKIGDTAISGDEILAEVVNIDAWNPITDGDSLIIDQSTLIAVKPTVAGRTLDIATTGEAGIDLDNTTGTLSATEIPRLDYFDTLIYLGHYGLGISIDSAASNTNTVIGTDGTEKNPVSTFVAARTLADALGVERYYLINQSTFNGAGTDLAAAHLNWEFYGQGHNLEMAFGGQNVTGSYFYNITLSGAMHASGGDVLYDRCDLGFISTNFNGTAISCVLLDTIVLKANKNITLSHCYSGVAGNGTPTIDFSAGSSTANIRAYSGGIRIMHGSSNDTISVETDGQVIISANNTSMVITLRGMITITDSGTTTVLTKDAVFSRQEADLWVWSNNDTTAIDSSLLGEWLSTGISASISAANMGAIADSVWDKDTTDAFAIAAGIGQFVKDSAAQTAAGSVTAQNMADIADSVLAHVDTAWASGTFGDQMLDQSDTNALVLAEVIGVNGLTPLQASDNIGINWADVTGQGAAVGLSATNIASVSSLSQSGIADAVWNEDSAGHYTSPQMAFVASQTSAGGLDSGIVSRVIGRKVWGLPSGSGDDSTTLAQRKGLVYSMLDSVKNDIVDLTWDEDSTGHYTSPNMAFLAAQTGASATDTANIKTMLAGNRDLVTGYHAAYYGRVNDAAPTTLAFVAEGVGSVSSFDATRSDNFYNDLTIIFISGNLKGRSASITDWKNTQDSLINDGFFAAPTNGDTFMVVSPPYPEILDAFTGTGANAVVIYAVDTTGTYDTLQGVYLTIRSLTQSHAAGPLATLAQGNRTFNLAADSFIVLATKFGYTFANDTISVSGVAANDSFAINGANLTLPTATSDSVSAVTVTVKSSAGVPMAGVWITARIDRQFVLDWDGNVVNRVPQRLRSDSNGRVTFQCLYSSAMSPTTKWIFATEGIGGLKKSLTVPSQASWTADLTQ